MLEHFKGEEVFAKKVLEYQDQALYHQRLVLTRFLNPFHQSMVTSIIGNHHDLQIIDNGGFNHSESRRMIIAPTFYEIEPQDFQIQILKITYPHKYERLRHGDILGALMSLGIQRELIGDIVYDQDIFYVAADHKISQFIIDNLKSIKHSKVKIVITNEKIELKNEYIKKSFIVSSFRLDKILSTFYKIPRSKAQEYIRAGHVKVNHKEVEEINYLCNNSDIISFKKHGRVKFVDTSRMTRSNNHAVEGYFYK